MKRLFICCALVLFGSYVAVASAAPTPNATGGVQFTDGSSVQSLDFNAHDGGLSVYDKGEVMYTNFTAGISYTADVECANVNVNTNTAYFAYEIPPGLPGLSGLGIVFRVVDGGTPGTNGDQVSFGVFASGDDAIAACDAGILGTVVINNTVTGGNLVVHKK
jgi:hypothetical protein